MAKRPIRQKKKLHPYQNLPLDIAIGVAGILLLGFIYSLSQNTVHTGIPGEVTFPTLDEPKRLAKELYHENPMKNIKVWKKIKKSNYKSVKHILKDLIQKKYVLSPWISNIFNNKKNNISINNQSFDLYKIKVRSLGFKKATKLKKANNAISK